MMEDLKAYKKNKKRSEWFASRILGGWNLKSILFVEVTEFGPPERSTIYVEKYKKRPKRWNRLAKNRRIRRVTKYVWVRRKGK